MKSVLMLNTAVGSLNQGDEIINRSIRTNWRELFECNYIMEMATHTPMYTTLQSMLYRKKLSIFKEADYKFLCGTNLLYTNMFRPLPSWNINYFNCGLATESICLGVGIGENSSHVNLYTRALYQKTLSHDYVHSARDEKTKRFLETLGFKAVNTGCPTLWGLTSEHCEKIPAEKADSVVFTLTYYDQDPVNDKIMINILKRNYAAIYFWPQCYADLEYLTALGYRDEVKVIPPNIEQFSNVLKADIDYVGSRLHGGIFAMQHFDRAIILAIDYRAREMSKTYSFTCMERTEVADRLEEYIAQSWNTKVTGIDQRLIAEWKKQFA